MAELTGLALFARLAGLDLLVVLNELVALTINGGVRLDSWTGWSGLGGLASLSQLTELGGLTGLNRVNLVDWPE